MTDHYDALETREPADARRRPVRAAAGRAAQGDGRTSLCRAPAGHRSRPGSPAGRRWRACRCCANPTSRPCTRPRRRSAASSTGPAGSFGRLFTSPGPIFEPEPTHADPWRGARALFAAGFRPGDVVLNTFSYHLTPGGFIFDASARALGCAVIPAGPGNTEAQFELIEAYRPVGYSGTPDFLKILLDAAAAAGRDVSSIKRALVSGAAFPKVAAGRDQIARRRCLSGVRHRRSRPDRL